jgi:primase-polymerase (primpol)-like protein
MRSRLNDAALRLIADVAVEGPSLALDSDQGSAHLAFDNAFIRKLGARRFDKEYSSSLGYRMLMEKYRGTSAAEPQ